LGTGNTWTGANLFNANQNTGPGSSPPLQAYGTTSGAMMSFHRGGYYAVNMGLDSDNVMRIGGWSAPASLWQLDMSGNEYLSGSSRAPIFYDSNNTSYYTDPASTSSLNGLTMAGSITTPTGTSIYIGNQNVSTSSRLIINWHNDSDYNYLIGKRAGAWTQPMDITFYTGIRYHAHNAYGGHKFYTTGYDSSEAMSIGNGDTHVRVINNLYAPILYDINNTGYYADLNGTTYCYYLQSATSVRADSDRRIKDNIETITDALNKVKKLRGTTFTRKDLQDKNKKHIGLIAQEVLEVIPEVVGGSEETTYSVGYGELVAVLIEAIKEQQEQIEEMRNLINGK
jgi:hypothetical protein